MRLRSLYNQRTINHGSTTTAICGLRVIKVAAITDFHLFSLPNKGMSAANKREFCPPAKQWAIGQKRNHNIRDGFLKLNPVSLINSAEFTIVHKMNDRLIGNSA